MKTTYKNMPLRQKGYPTLFWIAFLDSHISRHKPTSFTSTISSLYPVDPPIGLHFDYTLTFPDCPACLTSGRGTTAGCTLHYQHALIWQQPLVAQREGNHVQTHIASLNALIWQQILLVFLTQFIVKLLLTNEQHKGSLLKNGR